MKFLKSIATIVPLLALLLFPAVGRAAVACDLATLKDSSKASLSAVFDPSYTGIQPGEFAVYMQIKLLDPALPDACRNAKITFAGSYYTSTTPSGFKTFFVDGESHENVISQAVASSWVQISPAGTKLAQPVRLFVKVKAALGGQTIGEYDSASSPSDSYVTIPATGSDPVTTGPGPSLTPTTTTPAVGSTDCVKQFGAGYSPILGTSLCVPDGPAGKNGIAGSTSIFQVLAMVIKILLLLSGAIAVLFTIIGGFWYLTSAGNEEQATKGRKALTYAIIGLIIIVLSYSIVSIVVRTLGCDASKIVSGC